MKIKEKVEEEEEEEEEREEEVIKKYNLILSLILLNKNKYLI